MKKKMGNFYYDCLGFFARSDNRFVWDRCAGDTNFGDQITQFIVSQVTGRPPKYVRPQSQLSHHLWTGSILEFANRNTTVWGSGFISASLKLRQSPKEILAVRGELTRASLLEQGIKCPEVFGDPGELLKYFLPKDNFSKQYGVGVVPHYTEYELFKNFPFPNLHIINPMEKVEVVVAEINSCDYIFSSSLHGIIVADCYNIKCQPFQLKAKVSELRSTEYGDFKYLDYFSVTNEKNRKILNYTIEELADVCASHFDQVDHVYKDQTRLKNFINACPLDLGICAV